MRASRTLPAAVGILFTLLTIGVICSQDTGGGSTENFKRPSNPPVHRRPDLPDDASGGRVTGPAPSGVAQPAKVSSTGVAPGTTPSAKTESRPTSGSTPSAKSEPKPSPAATATAKTRTSTARPRKSSGVATNKSGSGPKPSKASTASKAPPVAAASAPPAPVSSFNDVEDAIEAGNKARDQKPPNYAEAERAYQVAAKMAPDDERAYIGLGNVYLDQRRDADAAMAYRKAINLETRNPEVSEALGDVYFRLSKYSESIESSTESVRLNPARPGPYWTLTWVNLTIGKGADAGEFANAFINRWKPYFEGDSPYYILFGGYLGYRSAGLNEKATVLLKAPGVSSDCVDTKWHCRILKYLRGEVTAQQLMLEADNQDKMTEAKGYIGLDQAFSGRHAEAIPHLRWVIEKGNRQFVEYHLAKEWLIRVEKK